VEEPSRAFHSVNKPAAILELRILVLARLTGKLQALVKLRANILNNVNLGSAFRTPELTEQILVQSEPQTLGARRESKDMGKSEVTETGICNS
jgi:hypothetical protein